MTARTPTEKSQVSKVGTHEILDHVTNSHVCTCRNGEASLKYVRLGVCVCVVLTVICVTACCVTVRNALFAHQQIELCREWLRRDENSGGKTGVRHDPMQNIDVHLQSDQESGEETFSPRDLRTIPDILIRAERGANSSPRKRKKSGRGKGRGKSRNLCRRIAKCPTQKGQDQKKTALKASHFTVDGSTVSGQIIGAFQPAEWMHANIQPAATSSDNEVSVTEDGVYLVYSTVLFNDTKYREGLVVKKNNKELFKCFDGVDYIDNTKNRTQNFKFKTCSVSGVTYLSKGDNLRMVNLYPGTNLDVSKGSTFFGLIQLVSASRTSP